MNPTRMDGRNPNPKPKHRMPIGIGAGINPTPTNMLERWVINIGHHCRSPRASSSSSSWFRFNAANADRSIPTYRYLDRWIQKPFGCQRYVNHLLDTKDTKTFWIQDHDKKTFWIVAYLSYHSTVLTITKANGYSRWRVSSRHLIRTDGQEFPVCHSSGVGVEG